MAIQIRKTDEPEKEPAMAKTGTTPPWPVPPAAVKEAQPGTTPPWPVPPDKSPKTVAEIAADKLAERKSGTAKEAPKEKGKVRIGIRLDPEIVAYFRDRGPGWQTDMNSVLRTWVELQKAAANDQR